MPLQIIRNDITKMHVDAIVNAANTSLLGGGGVDGAIHRAAGPQLLAECKTLHGCKTGEAKITRGYQLPCKYVIHTVGPVWRDGKHGERALLASCYRNSLALAVQHHCESIAFPMISAGAYGFPKDQVLEVATDTIGRFLLELDAELDLMVYLVVFTRQSVQISRKLFADVQMFIDDEYVDEHYNFRREQQRRHAQEELLSASIASASAPDADFMPAPPAAAWEPGSLEEALDVVDESFTQMLLRLIDEKGMTDPQCYKRANISKQHFAKIRKDVHYQPGKPTAVAFAIALELSMPETEELLMKAGLALNRHSKFDLIIRYCVMHGEYDIFRINEILYHYDQPLLGNVG